MSHGGCPIHGGYHGGYCLEVRVAMLDFRWWRFWLWWAWPTIRRGLRDGTIQRVQREDAEAT